MLSTISRKWKRRVQRTVYNKFEKEIKSIRRREQTLAKATDRELRRMGRSLKARAQMAPELDDLMVESYALTSEICHRQLGMRPYDVQLMSAIILHQGHLAQMCTGEGKTLVAVLPACLQALTGKGVHILTFNDYLAERDAHWMGPVYDFLELSVAFVSEHMPSHIRRKAYRSDITYNTIKNVGFDYLRDQVAYEQSEFCLRDFHYLIIDEADALLIDEARHPLVLAGNLHQDRQDAIEISGFVRSLDSSCDFAQDEFGRNIYLTDTGVSKAEAYFGAANLHHADHLDLLTGINLALQAAHLLQRDVQYIVRQDKVKLVDACTGRVVDDRRWQDGLQRAVEAKEGVPLQHEGQVLLSTTIQELVKLYPRVGAMTATAMSAADEFQESFNLTVFDVPPHREMVRVDLPDKIYTTSAAKYESIIRRVELAHAIGRPVLIGTFNVRESEELSTRFQAASLPHQVLNAKNDRQEAAIVAEAGKLGRITISTNMAGRGTDIKLGGRDEVEAAQVRALGGLLVVGTTRHESVRIDRQLRGRAGRQGDPGESQFYVSLEDELMVQYHIGDLLPPDHKRLDDGQPIHSSAVRKSVDLLQRVVEGQMFEVRKTLQQYAVFLEEQRKWFHQRRLALLHAAEGDHPDKLRHACLSLYDLAWSEHLAALSALREGIGFVRLAGKNPLREYYSAADDILAKIDANLSERLSQLLDSAEGPQPKATPKRPSATWTYVIDDKPFGDSLGSFLMSNENIGFQVDFISAPLLFLASKWEQRKRRRRQKRAQVSGY